MQYSRWGSHEGKVEGQNPLSQPVGHAAFPAAQNTACVLLHSTCSICLWSCPLYLLFLLCRKTAAQSDPWMQAVQASLAQALDRPAGGWRLRGRLKDKEGRHLPAALEVPLSPRRFKCHVSCCDCAPFPLSVSCIRQRVSHITIYMSTDTWGQRRKWLQCCGWMCMWGIIIHAQGNFTDTVAMELWEPCSSTSLCKEKPQQIL